MRCLILMHSVGGGAEFMALNLARLLGKQNIAVTLASVRHLPALAEQVPSGISFSMPDSPGLLSAGKHMRRLRHLAADSQVVLGSLELQSILAAALLAPAKAVGWLHKDIGGYLQRKGWLYGKVYATLLGWAMGRCRATVCVSEGIVASSTRLWPKLRGGRLRRIWNPLDLDRIRREAHAPLQDALQECFRRPVVLGVGRLAPEKAFSLLLEAHAILRQRGVEHNLCLLGEGPERSGLEAEVRRRGLCGSVFLPGFVNPYPAMSQARILALSSYFEGCPLVLVEALCLGLPVVSTCCPSGPEEVLAGGKYGRLVPVGHATALADALADMLDKKPDMALLRAGMLRAEDFAFDRAAEQWKALLAEVMDASSGAFASAIPRQRSEG